MAHALDPMIEALIFANFCRQQEIERNINHFKNLAGIAKASELDATKISAYMKAKKTLQTKQAELTRLQQQLPTVSIDDAKYEVMRLNTISRLKIELKQLYREVIDDGNRLDRLTHIHPKDAANNIQKWEKLRQVLNHNIRLSKDERRAFIDEKTAPRYKTLARKEIYAQAQIALMDLNQQENEALNETLKALVNAHNEVEEATGVELQYLATMTQDYDRKLDAIMKLNKQARDILKNVNTINYSFRQNFLEQAKRANNEAHGLFQSLKKITSSNPIYPFIMDKMTVAEEEIKNTTTDIRTEREFEANLLGKLSTYNEQIQMNIQQVNTKNLTELVTLQFEIDDLEKKIKKEFQSARDKQIHNQEIKTLEKQIETNIKALKGAIDSAIKSYKPTEVVMPPTEVVMQPTEEKDTATKPQPKIMSLAEYRKSRQLQQK
jgi:hypothetical protein